MAGLKKLWDYTRNTQLWNSIFRHGPMDTPRNRGLVVLTNVFLHLHPVKVRKSGIRLRFTWCMGGITFFLFLVEVATGLLLMFYYHPTVEYAYVDIVDLREQVPLGVMRELHRWGAHAMVITVWLHMLRVFMTGSYKPPREFNWNVGVLLLVLTLLLSFTGYLLPWDQLAMWAVTVGSNMARATPLLGHEGPGASLLKLGDISQSPSTGCRRRRASSLSRSGPSWSSFFPASWGRPGCGVSPVRSRRCTGRGSGGSCSRWSGSCSCSPASTPTSRSSS